MQSSIEFWKEPLGAQRLVVPTIQGLPAPNFEARSGHSCPDTILDNTMLWGTSMNMYECVDIWHIWVRPIKAY